jgi:sporulation protein YlmC with PRC-barrel domain
MTGGSGDLKLKLKQIIAAAAIGLLSTSAYAAQDTIKEVQPAVPQDEAKVQTVIPQEAAKVQTAVPQNVVTVTDWYKQDVFDGNDNKIGQIKDVLVDQSGRIDTLIIGVGGFLGLGEKDVAVPFQEVKATMKESKVHLVMDATKDSLKNAPGFTYDSNATTWVPDNKQQSEK